MRSILFLALLPLAGCALDDETPETSSDELAITVDNNCATGDDVNAESSVTAYQYDSYHRTAASTNNPGCRAQTWVKFTVDAPVIPTRFHTYAYFGSGLTGMTDAQCHNSTLSMQIFQLVGTKWKELWGAVGPGVYTDGICGRTGGDNAPTIGTGVYQVRAWGVVDGGPFSDMQIYVNTPPPAKPPT
jgi:YD repeat-containing protein